MKRSPGCCPAFLNLELNSTVGGGESIVLETFLDYMERTISLLATSRQNLLVWESGCDDCPVRSLLEVATTQVEQRGTELLLLLREVVS